MVQRKPFKEIIAEEIPLLFDGAMGTELYIKGIFINRCFEDANLTNPSLVTEIHREYKNAGAQVLTTNSWGANELKLAKFNLHDRLKDINIKAALLARGIARNELYVAGSVGPLGVRIEPFGPTSFDEAKHYFKEQIAALVEGGVDVISLETFSDITEIQQAISAAREVDPTIPVIAHLTIGIDNNLTVGTPLEWAVKKLDDWGVDALGLNCSVGPQPMMNALPRIRSVTKKPISVQPNAGLPKSVDGRNIYMSSPEYMAEFAKNFLEEGVQFIGGCCGTSPEHIKAMANALRHRTAMVKNETRRVKTTATAKKEELTNVKRVTLAEKSKWSHKIASGQKVFSVELLPPPNHDPTSIIEKSKILKEAGIDAVNIPDGPRASARMSAMLTAVMIEQQAQIETVLHYTCRDRNLLGMQSDMLGAQAIGLRNMLLLTGDPPKLGSYPDATGVFDIDAIGLTNMVYRLNGGIDLGSRQIGEPTSLSIGVAANPVARDIKHELKRFRYKVEAGAEWAITQPIFDINALFSFLEYVDRNNIRIPIIAGIWPLLSYRNAQFMHNEVPGVVIPDEIMERMSKPQTPEDSKKVGVEISREMVEKLSGSVQGVQVSAPFGRVDLALAVIGKHEL